MKFGKKSVWSCCCVAAVVWLLMCGCVWVVCCAAQPSESVQIGTVCVLCVGMRESIRRKRKKQESRMRAEQRWWRRMGCEYSILACDNGRLLEREDADIDRMRGIAPAVGDGRRHTLCMAQRWELGCGADGTCTAQRWLCLLTQLLQMIILLLDWSWQHRLPKRMCFVAEEVISALKEAYCEPSGVWRGV